MESQVLATAVSDVFASKSGLVLAATEQDARILSEELPFYGRIEPSRVVYIPDSETLPFDLQSAPTSISSERAIALKRLVDSKPTDNLIVITSASNALRKVSAPDFWRKNTITLKAGDNLNDAFKSVDPGTFLCSLGYQYADSVKAPGQWAARGAVLDMYPVGMMSFGGKQAHGAFRVTADKAGLIKSIRRLDTLTQESVTAVDSVILFPSRDYLLDKELVTAFRKQAREVHEDFREVESYKTVSLHEDHPELLSWIGAIEGRSTSILEMFEYDTLLVDEGVQQALEKQWQLISKRHEAVLQDSLRIAAPISFSWMSLEDLKILTEHKAVVNCHRLSAPSGMQRKPSLSLTIKALKQLLADGVPTLFVMRSEVRLKHMSTICMMARVKPRLLKDPLSFFADAQGVAITSGAIVVGHTSSDKAYRIISEQEVFGVSIESSLEEEIGEYHRKAILQGLSNIQVGDPIVHAHIGVGRFDGFDSISYTGVSEDVIRIAFADDALAYVKVSELDLISRYSGSSPEKAPLSKMLNESWIKGLKEAQDSAYLAAQELVKINTLRNQASPLSIHAPGQDYSDFCDIFPYDETPDQERAISAIVHDMVDGRPMDRLICGDVGFGKTEVAMRAAYLMASNGYQVAFLAPTTLLAEQHFHSVVKRFEETSIKTLLASKSSLSAKDMAEIRSGEALIIVGTHRLLQADMKFKNLGLLIVDEEHRFGVKQKQKLQSLRENKHMLSMAATPIPRTLGMAIAGIRDISIIATPPARRLAVRTLVGVQSDALIQEAISREMARSGQVFYLHNRIESIPDCVARIEALMPEARVRGLHGKMSESQLAEIMLSFRNHEFDVLVCTTVIEVGIDVPNANSILIENAENLGIAQLHQLRGRTGRSSRQAYCYLMVGNTKNETARRRMEAMVKSSNLGEGVMLARQDMEIRGIGEILGEEQSGHVHRVGFILYMKLLSRAINTINEKGSAADLDSESIFSHVEMPLLGRIPDTFIDAASERLCWYQRLISSESVEELNLHVRALEDAYGYIPDEVVRLKASVEDHIAAKTLRIRSIKERNGEVTVRFFAGKESVHLKTALMLAAKEARLKPLHHDDLFVFKNADMQQVCDVIRLAAN